MNSKLDSWKALAYWQTGEWQVVKERLKDNAQAGLPYVPARSLLFSSLDRVPFEEVRCVVMGQDPYPTRGHATGVAFSVPGDLREEVLPPTLRNIFKEYQDDLHYPAPKNGDLTPWCKQGVLLWNVYPSCQVGKPGSHHWVEWTYLTQEIVEKLDGRSSGVHPGGESPKPSPVFILLGNVARYYSRFILNSPIIETSHPSPLGVKHGFAGSRIFSRANVELCKLGQPTIDWRLEDAVH